MASGESAESMKFCPGRMKGMETDYPSNYAREYVIDGSSFFSSYSPPTDEGFSTFYIGSFMLLRYSDPNGLNLINMQELSKVVISTVML